jgi:hypothetical protein
MDTLQKIHIGILSAATSNPPHFKIFEQMLPPELTITNEGLACCKFLCDLEGKTSEIGARAADFVKRHRVQGSLSPPASSAFSIRV